MFYARTQDAVCTYSRYSSVWSAQLVTAEVAWASTHVSYAIAYRSAHMIWEEPRRVDAVGCVGWARHISSLHR